MLFDNGVWAMFAGFDRSVLQVKPGLLMGQADIDEVMAAFDRVYSGGGVVKQVLQRLEANPRPGPSDRCHRAGLRRDLCGLLVPGLDGKVAKRMSGFADAA